ncbi:hypothetical protein Tco_1188636 [Tanacetum coccineum]
MSTQQDIYVAGSENRPPLLKKENYVPWSSRLIRYAKSRPNGKLIYNSIINGPYVRRMIPEPGDQNRKVPVNETIHEQTDDEEIWLRVQQMMKGFDIGIQEKKAKLFNEWESFTSTDGETIEYYYHHCSTSMNMGQDRQTQMVGGNGGNLFRQYAGQNVRNQNGYNAVQNVKNQNPNGNGNVIAARVEGNAIENNGIQLQAKEFNLMAAAADLDKIKEVNANCILMANLQRSSTLEEQNTELLEPIPEPHQVQQNNSNVISEVSSMEQDGGTVDQHHATVEETRAYFESLYNNLAIEVEKSTQSIAKQCLTKKISALDLSSGKQITTLNEEISNLNNQLSKEKSTISSLLEEKKKLKSDFKIREDELLDKQIQLENKIKELDNILQAQQKQQSLYNDKVLLEKHDHPAVYDSDETLQLAQEIDAGLQNFKIQFLKEAGKFVRDFKSLAKEADESLAKYKALELEIERLLRAVASQDIMSIMQSNSVVDTSNLQTKLERLDNTSKTRKPQPRSNTKNDRVLYESKSSCINNKEVEVIQICLWCIDSGCSKNMTGNLKLLINFVWKFLGTVRFGNDHVAAILGFGD